MASLRVSLAFIFFHHKNNLLNEFSGDSLVKNNLGTIRPSFHIHITLACFGPFFDAPTYVSINGTENKQTISDPTRL
jgi:hypothetical protein